MTSVDSRRQCGSSATPIANWAVSRSIKHPLATADAIQTIASIRLRQGDFDQAVAKAEEAASLFLDVGAAPAASDALDIAAEAWERAGERERAEETSARARSLV